jgi:hypothetical protein
MRTQGRYFQVYEGVKEVTLYYKNNIQTLEFDMFSASLFLLNLL